MQEERMMKWFSYSHLPPDFQKTSKAFHDFASHMCDKLKPGPERTVFLRKLLEAKDAAVRAEVHPGG